LDQTFIQQTNSSVITPLGVPTSPEVVIAGNMCIVAPPALPAAADVVAETISYEVYEQLLEDYYSILQEQQIINNLISDALSITPAVYDPTDPESINTYQEELKSLEESIATMVDTVFDVVGDETELVQSCVADCAGLSTVDYAVCTAKCLCGEAGSPALATNGFEVIQAQAFKIRFCQVPASPTPVTRGRTIYSIEETLQEIRNIFVSLKNSGELFKHVRTKEFLDSSIKKNKFGKMFAFNIFVTSKGTKNNTPATQYKEEIAAANDRLESLLIRQSKNMASTPERNKYVLIDDPAGRQAAIETDGTVSNLVDRITQVQTFIAQAAPSVQKDTDAVLVYQKTAIINQAIVSFLTENYVFWESVTDMFVDINGIAENLRTKIQKAK